MTTHTGQCHCGKNAFAINAEPEFQFICYCHGCQILNGGGHLCGMMFDDNHLTPAKEAQTYTYKGGSGSDIVIYFCPTCSTQLYGYPTKHEGKVVIRANVLKDADFKSQQDLFPESRFGWDKTAHK